MVMFNTLDEESFIGSLGQLKRHLVPVDQSKNIATDIWKW
jgi:hypothetical protein